MRLLPNSVPRVEARATREREKATKEADEKKAEGGEAGEAEQAAVEEKAPAKPPVAKINRPVRR